MEIVIIGGGAAGFFAAINAAEAKTGVRVTILERAPKVLGKVRISGGGRCNVTHRPMEPKELVRRYPRGGRSLLGPFHRFSSPDTIDWFGQRGVRLKTEADGRMFPVTDDSATVIDCLSQAARQAGVRVRTRTAVTGIRAGSPFTVELADGDPLRADRLLLALGGLRSPGAAELITALGHTVQPPVPSLFSLHCRDPRLAGLAGLSIDPVRAALPEHKLEDTGPLLITHEGMSGPAVLRLSAWGARGLHAADYRTWLKLNWLPGSGPEAFQQRCTAFRKKHATRRIGNSSGFSELPRRLWESLVQAAGIPEATTWSQLKREQMQALEAELLDARYEVDGKSLNKDEFVTCGGVELREVDFRSMESKLVPGLFFAGEVLDVDGITGGFNFQAAWTTGWHAGKAMAV